MANQYATVDAWMAYFRNNATQGDPAILRKYAEQMAAGGVAPPDAGKSAFEENNAYRTILEVFESYGLGSLAPKLLEAIQAGYNTEAEVNLFVRETDEYKERFAANEVRRKKGLTTLSPAEYVAMERQYGQIMRAAGMPKGFYDQPEDFRTFLEGDVSVNEVQQRVQLAKRMAWATPDETRLAFQEFYGVNATHLMAYFLDPKKGMALIERQAAAAEIGGAMVVNGDLRGDRMARADRLAELGVTGDQARQGYQQIAELLPDATKLSDLYGDTEGRYDLTDAESEVFGDTGGAKAAKTRRGLASRERAAFSGSSGSAGSASLSTRRSGRT